MNKVFIGGIGKHSGKYYIKYESESGLTQKEYFDKLPKGIYFAAGYQNENDKGLAYISKMTNKGTSLIPVMITKTKKQLRK
jgi:hypothetical protein